MVKGLSGGFWDRSISLIFINDLLENLESKAKVFAGDTSLFSTVIYCNRSQRKFRGIE